MRPEEMTLDIADIIPKKLEEKGKFYIESYGCAMNFSDSEIVASVMSNDGYSLSGEAESADILFLNTCAIRDNAESRVRQRLQVFKKWKKKNPGLLIGLLGCMAERLKEKLLEQEKLVDIIAGPDSYRSLPILVARADSGQKAVNVLLSREETYAGLMPVRMNGNGVTAFISIMRGCDNMCSFCVVPFTRGRERSLDPSNILQDAIHLYQTGFREVTLLGQNVDSYHFRSNTKKESNMNFAGLLHFIASEVPELRIRFSTSHPKDMNNDVLETMARHENICHYIHLPVQSGSNEMLEKMNRGYTKEYYLERISAIREIMPDCGISSDIICGFCGESETDHLQTMELMEQADFDFAYTFSYSERPGTLAARKFKDDVSVEIKERRLAEIVALQRKLSHQKLKTGVGKIHHVLIEGESKKSNLDFYGRNQQNAVLVFPKSNYQRGHYVNVLAESCTSATLLGNVIY